MLRSSVSQREKEKAERATLVVQERLVKAKARAHGALEGSGLGSGTSAALVVQERLIGAECAPMQSESA